MLQKLNRRSLLRADLHNKRQTIRPPWAIAEALFVERCSRCEECIRQCDEGIIKKGDGGFPEIDFSLGECSFCQDCLKHCPEQALQPADDPWRLQARISELCLAHQHIVCMSCYENCEVEAIRMTPFQKGVSIPEIESTLCNGCGACVRICPTEAITICQTSI